MARALEVPMYQLLHEGEAAQSVRSWKHPKDSDWGTMGRTADYFDKLRKLLAKWTLASETFAQHSTESCKAQFQQKLTV